MLRSVRVPALLVCLLCFVLYAGGSARAEGPAAAHAEPAAAEAAPSLETTTAAAAGDEAAPAAALQVDIDAMWTVLAAFLVFFMQAWFAMVETGFTRAKNSCNILMKNLMDFSIGSLAFWALGFGLMFGASSATSGWLGMDNFLFDGSREAAALGKTESFSWAFLIFQTVFCATAATIVSGAMAERTKFVAYLLYSLAITAIVYPVFGAWAWGNLWAGEAWLAQLGFLDFAGSTVVHSIGGWCALAGALVIGPRAGKYRDGKTMPIPGHNIPLAALGVFILWLGWFGFNPGSTTAIGSDGASFAYIAVTTNLAAVAGSFGALLTSWIKFKKPDPSFTFNGVLAGLVAITAGCNVLTPALAIVTGFIGGCLVVFAVLFFDRLKIDDPVGAISVHGVCGAWGTIAVGLWPVLGFGLYAGAESSLRVQLLGAGVAFAWAFPSSLLIFYAVKKTVGLRVSAEEELQGLDITEHGMLAYPPGFVSELPTGSPVAAPLGYAPGMGVQVQPVSQAAQ
jgi:ammonium transporter, Amt family